MYLSGLIKKYGLESEIRSAFKEPDFDTIYDAHGGCVIPGLIDGHTHPVWAGDRVHEFAMKVGCIIYILIFYSIYIWKHKDGDI